MLLEAVKFQILNACNMAQHHCTNIRLRRKSQCHDCLILLCFADMWKANQFVSSSQTTEKNTSFTRINTILSRMPLQRAALCKSPIKLATSLGYEPVNLLSYENHINKARALMNAIPVAYLSAVDLEGTSAPPLIKNQPNNPSNPIGHRDNHKTRRCHSTSYQPLTSLENRTKHSSDL